MSIFCYKKLETASRTGTRLHDARTALGLTLEYISERTHIQKKYLEAMEQNHFSTLPKAKAYRLAYIREFASWVGLDVADITQQFIQENGLENAPIVHPRRRLRIMPFASVSILARNALFACLVLLFSGYLLWQVHGVLVAPKLTIFSPLEGYVANNPAIVVTGQTEKETRLTVNGQDIMVNGSGQFEATIDLTEGLNTLVITATKKHGKTTSVTRHLVVDEKPASDKMSLK